VFATLAPDPRLARGEYIAMTTCIRCHGRGRFVRFTDAEVHDLYGIPSRMAARSIAR
jgi:mono/diheme cytochrome c family protein